MERENFESDLDALVDYAERSNGRSKKPGVGSFTEDDDKEELKKPRARARIKKAPLPKHS